MSTFVNKFRFFIQEIFIIKKFDNVTVSQYLRELNINLSRVNRTTMNLLLKVSRFFHNLFEISFIMIEVPL